MKSISLKIEMPEILILCATILSLYEKVALSYVFISLGLIFALMRAAYSMHLREEEKKRDEKKTKELKQFLLKNMISAKLSPPSDVIH